MASWVASSNVSRASVWPYSPALILSSAVQNQPGKPWLPMTCVGMGGSVGLMGAPQPSKRFAMISRMISDVPEAMVQSRTSRKNPSTGNSRM